MQRRLLSLLLTFTLIAPVLAACAREKEPEPPVVSTVKLYQVLPVAREHSKYHNAEGEGEGEAIALINTGTEPQAISGWKIASSKGQVLLPKLTLQPGQPIYLANDAQYFEHYWNFAPTFEYGTDADKAVPDLISPAGNAPVLSDGGDVVSLLDDVGRTVDILAYGSVTAAPAPWTGPPVQLVDSFPVTPGNQVITRLKTDEGYRLEASAAAWSGGTPTEPQRVYHAGQSDFPVQSVTGQVTLTAGSAPDNAGTVIYDLVQRARKSIRLVGYQFNNKDLAEALVAAVRRGVRVTVGLERNPNDGGPFDSDLAVHEVLQRGGVEVLYDYPWDGDRSTRVSPVHSKYAIFDDDAVLVSSGDWTDSAYPLDASCGSRDWFAVIEGNADVVALFAEVWEYDFGSGHAEVRPWEERFDLPRQPDTYDPGACLPYTPIKPQPLKVAGQATITRILSPDNTLDRQFGFLGQLRSAEQELLISAAYIDRGWEPYLTEIVAAARRGVAVQVLLDSKRENPSVVQYLNDLAAKEQLKLEARLVNHDGTGLGRGYHNNSLIVDGAVVVSSMNGAESSFRYARELAVKVAGVPEFTQYYRELFLADWAASARPNRPAGVMAVPRNDGTYLDWIPNVELDVATYEIYYKEHADDPWRRIRVTERPGYTDNHTRGIWGVVAVTAAGVRSNHAEVAR